VARGTGAGGLLGRAEVLPNAQALDDRQAFAALGAACGEHFAAAGGGFARTETNLAGALFAVWAESRLHRFESLRGEGSAEPARPCQRHSSRRCINRAADSFQRLIVSTATCLALSDQVGRACR